MSQAQYKVGTSVLELTSFLVNPKLQKTAIEIS